MKPKILSRILYCLLWLCPVLAFTDALPDRPLSAEEAFLYRIGTLSTKTARTYAQPWMESDFSALPANGDANTSRKVSLYQDYFRSRERHFLRLRLKDASVTADASLAATGVFRSKEKEPLLAESLDLLVAANLGGRWFLLEQLTSRLETGNQTISPYRLESSTFASTAYRTPNVLQSYLSWRGDRVYFSVGRQGAKWGPGVRGSLLLSDVSGPKPMARLRLNLGWVQFTAFTAILSEPLGEAGYSGEEGYATPRYLSAHRLEAAPTDKLHLGVAETVLYARRLDPKFLNPVDIYFLDDSQTQPNNRNIGFDAAYAFLPNLQVYGEFFVDDYQPQMGRKSFRAWNSKGGILAGVLVVDPFDLRDTTLVAEVAFVNQYAYTHETPATEYTDNGVLLGHPIGTDAESLWTQITHYWTPNLRLVLEGERLRNGEGDVSKPHPFQTDADDGSAPETWDYLSGVVETNWQAATAVRYNAPRGWLFEGKVTGSRTTNEDNDSGKKRQYVEGLLTVGYRF